MYESSVGTIDESDKFLNARKDSDEDISCSGVKPKELVRFEKDETAVAGEMNYVEYPSKMLANVAGLSPSKLLFVPITVGEKHYKAMIDSGATFNMIRRSVWLNCGSSINESETRAINGLGNATLQTLGEACMPTTVLNLDSEPINYQVIEDKKLNVDIILGLSSLKTHKYIIDVKGRRISKVVAGTGQKIYCLSDVDELKEILYEKIPVRAAENFTISDRQQNLIPIDVTDVNEFRSNLCENRTFFYEGHPANKFLIGSDGIVEFDGSKRVLVSVCGKISTKEGKIRVSKGERIGYISSFRN